MQKQMLWHTFQEKNKQLELQHKWQLEHKFQVCISLIILMGEVMNKMGRFVRKNIFRLKSHSSQENLMKKRKIQEIESIKLYYIFVYIFAKLWSEKNEVLNWNLKWSTFSIQFKMLNANEKSFKPPVIQK